MTDVLTGLQTGLIEITFASPVVALVLQWHTKVKYITRLPVSYSYGVFAIEKEAFGRLSVDDQKIVREVMTKTLNGLDHEAREENERAYQTLLSAGLKPVDVGVDDLDAGGTRSKACIRSSWRARTSTPRCSTSCRRSLPSTARRTRRPRGLAQWTTARTIPGSHARPHRASARNALLVALLGFLIVFSFAQIVLRNVFSIGVTWGDGLTRVIVLWLALLGALAASRDGRHIRMNAFAAVVAAETAGPRTESAPTCSPPS